MILTTECNSCGGQIPDFEPTYSEGKFNVCKWCVQEEGTDNIFERLKDEAE